MHPPVEDSAQLTPITAQELSAAEVGELWSFVHGDIMTGSIREHLRSSLGLCPRHTWAYAAVEIELWQYGAGSRGGHQPFDVGVLYSNLLADVTDALEHCEKHPRRVHAALTPRSTCRICHDAGSDRPSISRVGFAGSNTEELTVEANRLEYTTEWCVQTAPMWTDRVCPDCAQHLRDHVYLCRRHLAERESDHDSSLEMIVRRLRAVESHLRRLVASMTQTGAPATGEDDASWIEALGWFAGWDVPLRLIEVGSDTR